MKLVLIYGFPGSGKLTVGKELQKLTGFNLLHNHLIADLVKTVFGFGHPVGKTLNKRIRTTIYEMAAEGGIPGLISTFSYYGDEQANQSVKEWIDVLKTNEHQVYFVRLICAGEILEKRIKDPSRRSTNKVTDIAKLRRILKEEIVSAEIPEEIASTLRIDNTTLSPKDTALKIIA